MNIITVIPLSRAKMVEELSYFTAADIPLGAIVSVPVRSKSVHAIVTQSKRAEDQKIDIKDAPFEIRKLGKVKATVFFPGAFVDACKILSSYYATTVGAVIDTVISTALLENVSKIAPPLPKQASFIASAPSAKDETFAIQGDDADRLSSWRSLIRQEFARKRSIAIYVPTIEDGDQIFAALEKGIEGYIFRLNSGLESKRIISTWSAIADTDHPIVVIATASFSLLPRGDIETVIIERENGRGWVSLKSPYLDLRHALETIARKRRQTVFLADCLLRTETLRRLDQGEIDQGSPFKWRSISTARDSLIDMKAYKAEENEFKILSPELEKLIETNREESTHLYILTTRRGLAPMTVCDDCETIVSCKNCSAPVVLHTSPETGKNFFMCHKCGERRSADESCAVCGGWRLTPLGIGIDRVSEEIRRKFPDADLFKIDSDTTRTEKQVNDVLDKFRARPGSIILGTELALHHLNDRVDHVAVVSLDSLFSLPDYRVSERIMYTLIRLRAQAARSILVQTRRPEEHVFEYGLKGNLSDFHRLTLAERKEFRYPPFVVLVKLTNEGKKEVIAKNMAAAQKLLEPLEVDVFPAFTSTVRGHSVIHGLIKMETHAWPDPEINAKLRSLPPGISVKVNPESLL